MTTPAPSPHQPARWRPAGSYDAAAIRRKATIGGFSAGERKNADGTADYLTAKKPYLDYATALARGWPIATGRMDITGARWGLDGAEAVLKLRALRSNGDWEE
jgi:hypothetical protein